MVSRWRTRTWQRRILLVLMLLLLSAGLVLAAGETMPRSLVSSGGGATTGALTLQSAIGQPVVGAVSGEGVLCSGFWCGPGAPEVAEGEYALHLPLVIRP